MDPSGKTALLTGATGGLGRAIAEALAERGTIMVLSSRKEEELEQLAASLPGSGHRVIVADLNEEGAAEKVVADAGEVDILIANAGMPATGRIDDLTTQQLVRPLRVNLEAPVRMAHAVIEQMLPRASGHLVFIGSQASKAATPRSSLYNATKFGLRGFALALHEDLRGTGVGCSIVLPGFIRDAGMFADSGTKPPPGMGTSSPEEVGEGVVTAITKERATVEVAPLTTRVASTFAGAFPGVASKVQGGVATKYAERLAQGQSDKR